MIGRSLRRLIAWPLSLALAFGLVVPTFPVAQGAALGLAMEICASAGAMRTQAPVGDPAPAGAGHCAGACALCATCGGTCAPPPAAGPQPALVSPTGHAAVGRASAAPAGARWLAARPRAPPSAA